VEFRAAVATRDNPENWHRLIIRHSLAFAPVRGSPNFVVWGLCRSGPRHLLSSWNRAFYFWWRPVWTLVKPHLTMASTRMRAKPAPVKPDDRAFLYC